MHSSSRRELSKLGCGLLLSVFTKNSAYPLVPPSSGPTLATNNPWKVFSRSGDDDFDRALIAELRKIVHILEINPGFKYTEALNAFAINETMVSNTRGTIILGLPLMKQLIAEDNGGVGVAAVCAHEGGHIYQFDNSLNDKLKVDDGRVLYYELHADFLAGYYLGRSGEFAADRIQQASLVTYRFGSYQYANTVFHGTPGQRAAAIEKGYRAATDGTAIAKAAEMGLLYVKNL
jgi:hypothetical protein